MQARMNIAGKYLARYQRESGFLNKIIAIDETWLKSYDPRDSKVESEWLSPGQSREFYEFENFEYMKNSNPPHFYIFQHRPKKIKQTLEDWKCMMIVAL